MRPIHAVSPEKTKYRVRVRHNSAVRRSFQSPARVPPPPDSDNKKFDLPQVPNCNPLNQSINFSKKS